MRTLSITDLQHIVQGAAFLGSGGGGPIAAGAGMIRRIDQLTKGKGVRMAAVDDIGAADDILVVADVGGADTFVRNQDRASWNAFEIMQEVTGRRFDFIAPVEIGPENSLAPAAVAARAGIPVIDGDGAGRAVPVLEMTTYAAAGTRRAPVSPAAIGAVDGHAVVIYANTPQDVEAMMRPIITAKHFSNSAGLAMWPMKGAAFRACAVPGGLSSALAVGRALAGARGAAARVAALGRVLGATPVELFSGTVTSVAESASGGFDFGTVTISAARAGGAHCTVVNQNENIAAWRSDQAAPLATVPHSLCWLAADGAPFSNAEAKAHKGRKVTLYGLPADRRMRTPYVEKVCLSLLASLGYPGPLVPVAGRATAYSRPAPPSAPATSVRR